MKRILTLLCVTLLSAAALSGCKGAGAGGQESYDVGRGPLLSEVAERALTASFESTANIRYKDIEAEVTIIRDGDGACVVSFSSPPELKDMAFTYTADQIVVSYKGLSFGFDPETLPSSAVGGMLLSALNSAAEQENLTITTEEGAVVVQGMMEEGEFFLRLDQQNGNFLKLSIPGSDFEMDFTNFTIL